MAGSPKSHDEWVLDAFLDRMATFPDAPVFALNDWSIQIDLPPRIDATGRPRLEFRAPADLGPPSELGSLMAVWTGMEEQGTHRTRFVDWHGTAHIICLWDLRHEYGAVLGMIVPDFGEREPRPEQQVTQMLPDRYGSTRRDTVGAVLDADEATCRMLGWDLETLRTLQTTELIHPDDQGRALEHWLQMLSSPGLPRRWRGRHQLADGTYSWFEFTDTNLLESPAACVQSDLLDISDEMAAIETLRERERLLDRLTETLPDGVMQVNARHEIVHQNARLGQVVGTGPCATFDETFATVVDADRSGLHDALAAVLDDGVDRDLEIRVADENGSERVLELVFRSLEDDRGVTTSVILSVSDVTDRVRLHNELEVRARYDALTDCLNRHAIIDATADLLADGREAGSSTGVIFIDLDGFKQVNDELGHAAGDELLRTVALRLRDAVRTNDLVGRLGGDEFLVVLGEMPSERLAAELADRLAVAVEQPVIISDAVLVPKASYGISWAVNSDVTVDELVARADRAMYVSKKQGTGRPVAS